jgi:DNA-binding PucR family transcriptional regulator
VAIAERGVDPESPKVWLTHSKHTARDAQRRYEEDSFDQHSAPIGYGASRGVLRCFRSRRFSKEETDLLNVLATQVSVLIDTIGSVPSSPAQVLSLLTSDHDDQLTKSLRALGWKDQAFVPVLAEVTRIGTELEQLPRFLHDAVSEEIGSETVVLQSGTLIVLLSYVDPASSNEEISERVGAWAARLSDSIGLVCNIGIGSSTHRSRSARDSFTEARAALSWAGFSSSRKQSIIVDFESIREMQELPSIVSEFAPGIADRRKQLLALRHHDEKHGTQLLSTLSAYAEHGGSVTHTADALFVHRNTLRQRLGRIEQLLRIGVNELTNWPEVLLAAKLAERR